MTASRKAAWILAACLAISAMAVMYPIYVIRPFRAQGPGELAAALVVVRIRPWITILSGLAAAAVAVWYWRFQSGRLGRSLAVAGAAATLTLALLARVNVYELMFHPVDRPAFADAQRTRLDADEKVIAVQMPGEARAYPVRIISYHHIVNDVVGGAAIAATY